MSHLRDVVAVPQTPSNDAYGVPATFEPLRKSTTTISSADPNNKPDKRTDPFQFGSRYLEEGDDIFAHNAWDNVETDTAYQDFAETQYAAQRESPVSDFDKHRFNSDPAKWWNKFYAHNTANFFKDRKWLAQEFPVLAEVTREGAPACKVLEVGAGAGNTAFPILKANRNERLKVYACDFSKKAVEVMRGSEAYDERFMQADVWDVAAVPTESDTGLPPDVGEESVDVVMMIFIFSALAPGQWDQALRNIWRVLKPGGLVLFRDYGRGDLAQVRFKKGRYLDENFYVRGDGTRVYFFEKEELVEIWTGKRSRTEEDVAAKMDGLSVKEENNSESEMSTEHASSSPDTPAFEVLDIGVDRRMLVNRQRRLKMYRCWMQARFQKPTKEAESTTVLDEIQKHSHADP